MSSSSAKEESLFSFSLLWRGTTRHLPLETVKVRGIPGTDTIEEVIEHAARDIIAKKRDRLTLPTNFEMAVYMPPRDSTGGAETDPAVLGETFTEGIDDEYLRRCSWVPSIVILPNETRYFIVVFDTKIKFFLFDALDSDEYFDSDEATVGFDHTIADVLEEARQRVLFAHWVYHRDKAVDVTHLEAIEPNESVIKQYESQGLEYYDCSLNSRRNVIFHEPETPAGKIKANSLIIRFKRRPWPRYTIHSLLKVGSSHKRLDFASIRASPDDVVDTLVERARTVAGPDFEFSSVERVIGNHDGFGDEDPRGAEGSPELDDQDLQVPNTQGCLPQQKLGTLASNIVVVIFVSVRKSKGDHEEILAAINEGCASRMEMVKAARKRKPPSEDARPSTLLVTQQSKIPDAVYNTRPTHLAGPPIQIYHPVFTKFLSRAFLPFEGDEKTLQDTWEFIRVSRQWYKDKDSRMAALRTINLPGLVHVGILNTLVLDSNGSKYIPDGAVSIFHPLQLRTMFCAFVEVKNEVGTGGCDPAMQCQSDFVKLCCASTYRPVFETSCCPMFLVAIAGPHLSVSGAVAANTFITQELTGYVSLGSHPTDPDGGLRRVAQILVTLGECIEDLTSFYCGLEFVPVRLPLTPVIQRPRSAGGSGAMSQDADPPLSYAAKSPLEWIPPYRTEFVSEGKQFSLTYKGWLRVGGRTRRELFTASMDPPFGDGLVIVKFTRRYGVEAHKTLAKLSLAPKLFYHEESVGVHFVVMEHLGSATELSDNLSEVEGGAEHIERLRQAVRALHDRGLVFGDLREPNIMIAEDGLKLVDFDWSGNQGEVRYPVGISRQIKWPEGVEGEGVIKFEHDREWFKQLTGTEL